MRRILLCAFRDGEVKLTADGTALLLGIGVSQRLWAVLDDPAGGVG